MLVVARKQQVKPLLPSRIVDGILSMDTESMRSLASDSELKLIWYIRNVICWGEITVVVKNGEPVRILEPLREVKLQDDNGKS